VACESVRRIKYDRVLGTTRQQTAEEREVDIRAALAKLEVALESQEVTVTLSSEGAACLVGWTDADRDGVTDACAALSLSMQASWAWTLAVQAAEARTGYRYNAQSVAAGYHSHDSGRTWGTH
jgi:hypothetical protein